METQEIDIPHNNNKKNNSIIQKILDWIYLYLSECDGMCQHCDEVLKNKCQQRKQ